MLNQLSYVANVNTLLSLSVNAFMVLDRAPRGEDVEQRSKEQRCSIT